MNESEPVSRHQEPFTFHCRESWQQPAIPVPYSDFEEINCVRSWGQTRTYLIYFELREAAGAAVLGFVIEILDNL
jgi:hypothetical protein